MVYDNNNDNNDNDNNGTDNDSNENDNSSIKKSALWWWINSITKGDNMHDHNIRNWHPLIIHLWITNTCREILNLVLDFHNYVEYGLYLHDFFLICHL